jgi:NAD(P)-dependent dehydrogenase (short-subunit alcohol dehydrogenase family)
VSRVVVTGASRGVGAMVATALVERGHTVTGLARSAAADWECDERVARIECDIEDDSAARRAFSQLRKDGAGPDVLIHAAGAFSADLLAMASGARVTEILAANVSGAQNAIREAIKEMRRGNFGRVVALTSIAPRIPMPGNAIYGASKLALEHLVRSYAVELKGSGCTFNCLGLSFVEGTGMVDALRPEARASYEQRLAAPEGLDMTSVMHAIDFFILPEASAVTGQTVVLGGPY